MVEFYLKLVEIKKKKMAWRIPPLDSELTHGRKKITLPDPGRVRKPLMTGQLQMPNNRTPCLHATCCCPPIYPIIKIPLPKALLFSCISLPLQNYMMTFNLLQKNIQTHWSTFKDFHNNGSLLVTQWQASEAFNVLVECG